MIQKGTKRRYQSATEVLDALNPIVNVSSSLGVQIFKTPNPKTVSLPPSIKVSQPPSSQFVSTTLQTVPTPFELGNKWGYEDANGKVAIKIQFDYADDFSEGLARVEINSKWGYIDPTGKVVVPIQFDSISNFSNGLARVGIGSKYGYIDITGKIQFDNIGRFSEGLAWFQLGFEYGYIDTTGKIVIPPQFEDADNFSEGLAKVKIDSKYGYINKNGKIVIPPQFEDTSDFQNGKARATKKVLGLFKKEHYIDKTGKFID